ncbi:MAG: MOSC domain-containing protein [Candidatus Eiseniibacteriota bacterium]
MRLAEIWRYPVKSLAGERLDHAALAPGGIAGDRLYQVHRADGSIVDARAHPKLLALHAHLNPSGQLLIDDQPWDSPQVARAIEAAAAVGPGAHLERHERADRFDVLPLLIATDGAIAALGHDGRRLRPNLVIGGVEGLAEREWGGHALEIGETRIGVLRLRPRCVMTTWDPDTQAQDLSVLRELVERFDSRFALDGWVIRGGTLRVGDPVRVSALSEQPGERMWGRYAGPSAREGRQS